MVMNSEYLTYPLVFGGMIAGECEYTQVNGSYFLPKDEKKFCMCDNFKPRAFTVRKMVDEWRRKHGQAV